jgi:LPS-assembly protein
VFAVKIQNWDKIKHEIKPEIFYSYIPGVDRDNLPNFIPRVNSFMANSLSSNIGQTDVLTEQNAVAWALTNTVTARVQGKSGSRSYFELLRFKLFQVYDINEAKKDMAGSIAERRPVSDLGIEFDLKPHPYVSFAARNKYNPYVGWKEMNYDLGLRDGRGDNLTLGYRYTLDSLEEINMTLKLNLTRGFSGNLILRRDQFNDRTVENTVGLVYRAQCWGVGVDYTKTHDDERILLKFSLAGLGIF